MNKKRFAKCLAAAVLGVSFAFSGAILPATAEYSNISAVCEASQTAQGAISWEKGADAKVMAYGYGVAPEGVSYGRGNALARRAAIVDAYRNLAEIINGVQIDSETTIRDMVVESDVIRTQVSALVKGAVITSEEQKADGSYVVSMTVPMYGVKDSVAAVAIPAVADVNSAPVPQPAPQKENVPASFVEDVQQYPYTGIVINAKGLDMEATFAPVIEDRNGRVVYGLENLDYNRAISEGMVAYATDVNTACTYDRVGSNPLIINAVGAKGGVNSTNKVNAVVTAEDADRILLVCQNPQVLTNMGVVFVK